MAEYWVGLMSGTSLDGIDAVVVDFASFPPRCCAAVALPITEPVKQRILALCQQGENEIERLGQLDVELAELFAEAACQVVEQAGLEACEIVAIGSHGQTVRHEPEAVTPFTLQIGDPNVIAQRSGITTVADFRRRDLAVGGQGAPLVPAYHHWLLHDRGGVVLNVGGMANVTLLPESGEEAVIGFDTGPGNVLIDGWALAQWGEPMDRGGKLASRGVVYQPLLEQMLSDPFFSQPPPKSTGRERFNAAWVSEMLEALSFSRGEHQQRLSPYDVAATLTELTAVTIADALRHYSGTTKACWVCGGGAHNGFLLQRVNHYLPGWNVNTTEAIGADPDWVEAMAFAWLARQTLHRLHGNIPSVTGANQSVILGAIFPVESQECSATHRSGVL